MNSTYKVYSTGTILNSSRFFIHKVFGLFNDEIIGKNLYQFLRDKDLEVFTIDEKFETEGSYKRKKQKLSENESKHFGTSPTRVHIVHKSGRIHSFSMLVSPFCTASGEKRFIIQLSQIDNSGVSSLWHTSINQYDLLQSGPAEAIQSLSPYILQNQIDEALCGSVFTAINKHTGESVVVKVQAKALMDEDQQNRAEAEYAIAAKLNHPNIIGYLEQIDTGQHICTGTVEAK